MKLQPNSGNRFLVNAISLNDFLSIHSLQYTEKGKNIIFYIDKVQSSR